MATPVFDKERRSNIRLSFLGAGKLPQLDVLGVLFLDITPSTSQTENDNDGRQKTDISTFSPALLLLFQDTKTRGRTRAIAAGRVYEVVSMMAAN